MSEHERSHIVKFKVALSYKNYLNGLVVNPTAYGILRLSQLQGRRWGGGGGIYPIPQKTMLKLFDWFQIWYT